jgi:hypothetical protein
VSTCTLILPAAALRQGEDAVERSVVDTLTGVLAPYHAALNAAGIRRVTFTIPSPYQAAQDGGEGDAVFGGGGGGAGTPTLALSHTPLHDDALQVRLSMGDLC